MSTDLYRAHADTLLLTARTVAVKAASPDLTGDRRIDDAYDAVAARAAYRLRQPTWQEGRAVLAALISAHALHLTVDELTDSDCATADMLGVGVRAMRHNLGGRLTAAREVLVAAKDQTLPGALTGAISDLAGLLRRSGDEYIASCGHLVRRVVTDPRPYLPHLADAWYGVCGQYLLLPREVGRAAALGMVAAGQDKSAVARLGGLSRTTLDTWLAQA